MNYSMSDIHELLPSVEAAFESAAKVIENRKSEGDPSKMGILLDTIKDYRVSFEGLSRIIVTAKDTDIGGENISKIKDAWENLRTANLQVLKSFNGIVPQS